MDAPALFKLLKRVLDGLFEKGIRVVSYASDGTIVERSVQRLLLAELTPIWYSIKYPCPGCDPTVIDFGTYHHGQMICIIQDSKHALKTLQNNLFSGARLLMFSNFTSIYWHIAILPTLPRVQGHHFSAEMLGKSILKTTMQPFDFSLRMFSNTMQTIIMITSGKSSIFLCLVN